MRSALDFFRNSLCLKKLRIFEQFFCQILRAYVHIWSKNLAKKLPKRLIFTSEWNFERSLLLFCFIFLPCFGHAAFKEREPAAPSLTETLRYTLRSQQSELHMLQERFEDYEAQLDLLRNDFKRALKEQDEAAVQSLQKLTLRVQESEQENKELRRDLAMLVDHFKEVQTLIESLQTTLQQQMKKGQLLEKTLSTLISSLSPSLNLETAEHKVQAGETLEKIARKYGISIRLLKEQNQLETDRIRVGQTLKLPSPSPSPP